jgi:hypothetical protein
LPDPLGVSLPRIEEIEAELSRELEDAGVSGIQDVQYGDEE